MKRVLPPPENDRSARRGVFLALAASAAGSLGFIAAYLADGATQLLGLALSVTFGGLATAAILAGKHLVPQEELEEPLESHEHLRERVDAAQVVREAGDGLSRRRLLVVAAGGSVGLCGAALVLPAASLGPLTDTSSLRTTPWGRGRRLVDSDGSPLRATDIAVGTFQTAFPEGADHKRLDAPVIVVRLRLDELRLPAERAEWAPDGLCAFSKTCTHAACAVSLFQYPKHAPTSPPPRLVCPCHYSVFDPRTGGEVLDGPAGRPLPQLPLVIEEDGTLSAGGGLSAPPGPSWSGVRS